MDEAIAAGRRTTLAATRAEPTAPARLIANPADGVLSDRTGKRKPFVIGCGGPRAAGVVLGLMNSYPALFARASLATTMARRTVSRARSVR